MLRKAGEISPLLLVIKDLHSYIFGAYISVELRQTHNFIGNGEMFLFRKHADYDDVEIYKWSEQNNDFLNFSLDGIGFGWGERYGLFINENLLSGSSARSPTFMNECLSYSEDFEINTIELWGVSDL